MKLKFKFNIKPFLNYLAVILMTALGITSILIALPLTEKVSEKTPFNLITKDNSYWSKEYLLKLETENEKEIQKTKDILYKRLSGFGVEEINILQDTNSTLKITVKTVKDEDIVKELISNRFSVQIVTRKDDVDFLDEENQYAYLFADNYNSTDWTREDFRNVYITELRTSDNNYSQFAIFKLWTTKQGEFHKFLKEYAGEYIGVNIDGFVTPYLVPIDDQSIFAVPISTDDPQQIQAMSLLYNSGVIPINYSLENEDEIKINNIQLDYIRITIGILISLVTVYIYLGLIKDSSIEILKKSFLATVLTTSLYLSILKLFEIPIDTFLLAIQAILSFILINVLTENKDSNIYIETALVISLLLIKILSTGYMEIFATQMISLVLLSKISLILSGWYLNKVKNI